MTSKRCQLCGKKNGDPSHLDDDAVTVSKKRGLRTRIFLCSDCCADLNNDVENQTLDKLDERLCRKQPHYTARR